LLVTLERTLAIGEAEVRDGDFFFTTHSVALCLNAKRFDTRRLGVTKIITKTTEK